MHELGYAVEIVDTLEEYMIENKLKHIKSVTLTVGEATAIIPHYMHECWPAAIENSKLSDCELNINFVRVKGRCHDCENEFLVTLTHGVCPKCGCEDYDMMNGYEFEITEIVAI